jgi:hypothetical protein
MTTKANADCKTALCQYDSATRTRFFNGMLLSDEHLRAEQVYHREALKRINRYMWGAGIVCGLEVEKVGFCLKVHPGFALDCEGNAIEVCRCITIDMADLCKDQFPGGCAPAGRGRLTRCLTIRYKEIDDGTVAVTGSGDDCSGGAGKPRRQASRVREGFCLEFTDPDKCPKTSCKDDDAAVTELLRRVTGKTQRTSRVEGDECMQRSPECPACTCHGDDCGVCLAEITIDCEQRAVTDVKGDCRSYVWTAQLLRKLAAPAGGSVLTEGYEASEDLEAVPPTPEDRPEPAPPAPSGRRRSRATPSANEREGD